LSAVLRVVVGRDWDSVWSQGDSYVAVRGPLRPGDLGAHHASSIISIRSRGRVHTRAKQGWLSVGRFHWTPTLCIDLDGRRVRRS
jgi:hypothetical protein